MNKKPVYLLLVIAIFCFSFSSVSAESLSIGTIANYFTWGRSLNVAEKIVDHMDNVTCVTRDAENKLISKYIYCETKPGYSDLKTEFIFQFLNQGEGKDPFLSQIDVYSELEKTEEEPPDMDIVVATGTGAGFIGTLDLYSGPLYASQLDSYKGTNGLTVFAIFITRKDAKRFLTVSFSNKTIMESVSKGNMPKNYADCDYSEAIRNFKIKQVCIPKQIK